MTRVGLGVGLIETMRARHGNIPWLGRHLARLSASLAALDLVVPPVDLRSVARRAAAQGDQVVRLEVRDGGAEVTTRAVSGDEFPSVVVSSEPHVPYPHKTTERGQFGRALAGARRVGASDALLITPRGHVAEGTAWSVFWWDQHHLCTPPLELGILPGIGRSRVLELEDVREVRVSVSALEGRSLFLVNAVRGIVEIGAFEGTAVPRDPRTPELSRRFWPD